MRDPSLLSEIAEELRDAETLAEVAKIMADPNFEEQARAVAKQLQTSGFPMEIFTEQYGEMPEAE